MSECTSLLAHRYPLYGTCWLALVLNTTEERSRGSIAEATCLQGGADDDVNGLLIGALTGLVARQSAVPDDVNGLLIAALTGLVARQSAVAAKSCCSCPSMRCQTERASWLVSEMQWRSGHAD